MGERAQRKPYLHTNKYQRRIIILVLVPTLVLCATISVFILYFQKELIDMVLYATNPPSVEFINQWSIVTLVALWLLFIFVVSCAYKISSNLLGAFERVITELDDIIAGKERKQVQARPPDDLANELLKRINVLIRNVPGPDRGVDVSETKGRF